MKKIASIFLFIFCSIAARCQELFVHHGNEVTYKNNRFHVEPSGHNDTIRITDPVTGIETIKVLARYQPVSVNGRKIYTADHVTTFPLSISGKSLDDYLLGNLARDPSIKFIEQGLLVYDLRNIVLDEKGKVIYYDFDGLKFRGNDDMIRTVGYHNTIDSLLSKAPPMKPATLNGKNVPVLINCDLSDYIIRADNHHIRWSKKN